MNLDAAPPLVSVVIPTYNAPDMLSETLQSVFAQTFRNFEVVVVNDGSTDDTAERLKPLAEEGRIRLINQENGGIGVARNRGIDEARGKYVALLDHDDLWMPGKLEAQVSYAQAHPECAIVTVPWARTCTPERRLPAPDVVGPEGIIARPLHRMAHGNMLFCSSSMLFEKSRLVIRYGEARRCIEDTQAHFGLLSRGKLGVAGNEILMLYRVHASNYSSQADFWDNGIRWLRKLDREGAFDGLQGMDRRDLLEFLAHIGRTATASRLLSGQRGRALRMYAREWPHQVRDRAWKYLAGTPALALAPRPLIRRTFGADAERPGRHAAESAL